MEQTIAASRPAAALGVFERYLTLWVALCIVAGITLGAVAPGPFRLLGGMSIANVNMPVAVVIWLMIVPMLLRVDFSAIGTVAQHWRGIAVTVGINWPRPNTDRVPVGRVALGWLIDDTP